jgi:transcriptional regulator with XRE-family HTH domain
MYTSPSVEKMLIVLRRELRSKGLRLRDLTSLVGMSESSVKRYLRGRGLTLGGLEKLAKVVDLDLLSLAILASREEQALETQGERSKRLPEECALRRSVVSG